MPTLNTNALYQVVLNGRYNGNAVVNVLYYRLAQDLIPGDLNFGGAEVLANLVRDDIFNAHLKNMLPSGYLLDNITVYPRDTDFNLLFSLPHVLPVGVYGGETDTTNGPAPCLIAKFNLEPTSVFNGFNPPTRGYLAIGPVLDSAITPTGYVEGGAYASYSTRLQSFAANLTSLLPPASFFPIRLKTTRVLGVITLQGWADIASVVLRHRASFRRSRQPEAL